MNVLSLSHQTISRQIYEIEKSMEEELESIAANFKFYALGTDESTDSINAGQLAIFIWCINDYNIIEKLASLIQLKDTTRDLWCIEKYSKSIFFVH